MHGTQALVQSLVPEIASYAAGIHAKSEVVLCPPHLWVPAVAQAIRGSFIQLGAQDCSPHTSGAFTGEISAARSRTPARRM